MRDDIINYGRVSSSQWANKQDFVIRWKFRVPYKNSATTWMVGSGTKASGARYKLYQDSNRNGKFDASKGDAYVGSGAANKRNYSAFTSIFDGRSAEVHGYADYTADLLISGKVIGSANWF